jgi:hypothetical protein
MIVEQRQACNNQLPSCPKTSFLMASLRSNLDLGLRMYSHINQHRASGSCVSVE